MVFKGPLWPLGSSPLMRASCSVTITSFSSQPTHNCFHLPLIGCSSDVLDLKQAHQATLNTSSSETVRADAEFVGTGSSSHAWHAHNGVAANWFDSNVSSPCSALTNSISPFLTGSGIFSLARLAATRFPRDLWLVYIVFEVGFVYWMVSLYSFSCSNSGLGKGASAIRVGGSCHAGRAASGTSASLRGCSRWKRCHGSSALRPNMAGMCSIMDLAAANTSSTFKNGVPSRLFSGNSACGGTLSGGPCGVWKISMPFSQTWSYCFSPSTMVNIGAPVASFLDG
mmetsp:Transcript_12125/g.31821  ORF Transcript_12125/g.31821 Transcript_12125/m.31821 type:complete len:283 (-) Transcript_12125:2213-3061(-)